MFLQILPPIVLAVPPDERATGGSRAYGEDRRARVTLPVQCEGGRSYCRMRPRRAANTRGASAMTSMPKPKKPPRRGSKSDAMRSHDAPRARPRAISKASVRTSQRTPSSHQRRGGWAPSQRIVSQTTSTMSTEPLRTLTCRARRSPSCGSSTRRRTIPWSDSVNRSPTQMPSARDRGKVSPVMQACGRRWSSSDPH